MAIFLLILCMMFASCGGDKTDDTLMSEDLIVPEEANYETVQVTKGEYSKSAQGSASLAFPIWAELSWKGGEARLEEVLVKNGQSVKKGDVLAVFEVEVSTAEKAELELQLQRKKEAFVEGKTERLAAIKEAKANISTLSSYQLKIAQLDLEKMEVSYDLYVYQTEREIASLQERLDTMKEEMRDNTMVAPFDGIVKSVASYHVGDKVNAGEVIVSMYSEEVFGLRVSDAGNKLRYGMEVTIETGRKNEKKYYTGVVVAAPNIMTSTMSQSDAYIRINENVSPGDFQNSIVFYANTEYLEDVLVVDRKATGREDGNLYVNILEDGAVKKRYVAQGLTNTEVTWIVDGLSEGQTLIVE